jgi:hypothetical protein
MKLTTAYQKIIADPIEFISRLKIVDKKGKLTTLKPNEEQIKIIQTLHSGGDTLILKPRQIGSSTIVCAYFFWKAYTAEDPITHATLSHKLASSKHLLEMQKRFYHNLPDALKIGLSIDNTTEFRFANGAGLIAVSAEGKGGLRSFTCSSLHISEYAFADNPEELKATAIAALNGGQLVIESTANYFNDALHQEVMKHERGLAEWNYLFFPWYSHTEYMTPINRNTDPAWTEEELEIKERFSLTFPQLWWRRKNIEKIGLDKFTREYPTTLEEAYRQIGNSYFSSTDLTNVEIIKVDTSDSIIFEDPDPDDRYAMGVDVAAGVNRDYSVIQVLSKKTYQPVAIFRSNKIIPVELAEVIDDLSKMYNDATALIESNNYGNVVINELKHMGFKRFWLDTDGTDWQTTSKSKVFMFENLKTLIRTGKIRQIDNITYAEIRSLQVNEKGTIIIPDNLDSHGDNAVALALCSVCIEGVKLPEKTFLPSWIIANKASKVLSKSGVGVGQYRRY